MRFPEDNVWVGTGIRHNDKTPESATLYTKMAEKEGAMKRSRSKNRPIKMNRRE